MAAVHNQGPDLELRSTAYHEAGHAVAAFQLGLKIESASIAPGEDFLGVVKFSPQSIQSLASAAAEGIAFDYLPARLRNRLERNLIVSFAGPCAEARFRRRRSWLPGYDSDLAKAVDLVDQFMPRRSAEAYVNWLCARSEDLVSHPQSWAAIGRLAGALLQQQTLSGAAVRALLKGASNGF